MQTMVIRALRGACLVTAVAAAGLWARSYFVSDQYMWPVKLPPSGGALVDSRAVLTTPGRFVIHDRSIFM
jgi:hypothetical protein